jgi:hypothetical protein
LALVGGEWSASRSARFIRGERIFKILKLQWLQDQSKINGDNLHNIRLEASRHFGNKKREYLKDKINELATNSKNKTVETCIEE